MAFRDVLAPVRFFTPFPPQPSQPCGTPRIYQISRPDISQPYLAPPDVLFRAHTVLGPNFVGFPRGRLGKAKSSDVASSIPEYSSRLYELHLTTQNGRKSLKTILGSDLVRIDDSELRPRPVSRNPNKA